MTNKPMEDVRVTMNQTFETLPPIRPFRFDPNNGTSVDFTGMTFGRFTVLGVIDRKGADRASWVIQCG